MSTLLQSDPDSSLLEEANGNNSGAGVRPSLASVGSSGGSGHHRLDTPETSTTAPPEKISIRFQPIGLTAALARSSYKVAGAQTVGSLQVFLKRALKVSTVRIYVLSAFEPAPEEKLGELFKVFRSSGELVLSYCETVAFG